MMIPKLNLNSLFLSLAAAGFVALSGCSTQELKVDSNPVGADVVTLDAAKNPHVIGQTPIVLNATNAPDIFKGPVQISISKDGFKGQSILLPGTRFGASGEVRVELKANEADLVNETAEEVAHAQSLLFKKDFDVAEKMLKDLISKKSSVAVFHSLLGNVFYLKKDLTRALESYEHAYALEPKNVELDRMIKKLKGIRSVGSVPN
jgi:tetratricopeptide (TPR) repeat protein